MRAISAWAHHHKWPARLLIILLHLLLAGIATLVGRMLLYSAVVIPVGLKYALLVPALVLLVVYPANQKVKEGMFYSRQQVLNLLLLLTGFLIIVCMGNNRTLSGSEKIFSFYPAWGVQQSTAPVQKSSRAFSEEPTVKKPLTSFKVFQKKVKANWQKFRKQYKATSQTGKIALIILSVLVAFFLVGLISALSCSIACNGSGVLAAFVMLAGSGLIILALVKVLQRIKRGSKPKKPATPKTSTTPVENSMPHQSF